MQCSRERANCDVRLFTITPAGKTSFLLAQRTLVPPLKSALQVTDIPAPDAPSSRRRVTRACFARLHVPRASPCLRCEPRLSRPIRPFRIQAVFLVVREEAFSPHHSLRDAGSSHHDPRKREGRTALGPLPWPKFFLLRVSLRLAEPRVLASSDTRFFGCSSTHLL